MFAQAKWPAAVNRHHFVHRIGKQKAAIERRDPRVLERQELAVQQARGQGCTHANHRRMVSTSRRHQLPDSTAARGCSGKVATVWPAFVTRREPTEASAASGAMS